MLCEVAGQRGCSAGGRTFECVADMRNGANSPLAKHLVCDNIVPSEDRLPRRISAGFVLLRILGIVSMGDTPRQAAQTTTVGPGQGVQRSLSKSESSRGEGRRRRR